MLARFGARLIDAMVAGGVAWMTVMIASVIIVIPTAVSGSGEPSPAALITLGLLAGVGLPTAAIAYDVVCTAKWGQTLGKLACGVKVVREDTGRPPSAGAAFLRWLLLNLTGTVIIGYFSPWMDPCQRLRGWHDRATGVIVLRSR